MPAVKHLCFAELAPIVAAPCCCVLQAPCFRSLSPAEREVLLLLGTDIAATQGQMLIQENDKVGRAFGWMGCGSSAG